MRTFFERRSAARLIALVSVGCLVLLGSVVGTASVASAAGETDLYVAVSASGTGDCSSVANSCTLATAKSAVHTLTSATLTSNIVVNLAGGTYPIASTLTFSASDSGNNNFTVTWQAASGAHPVLTGGAALSGWALVSGSTTLYSANVAAGTQSRQLYVNGRRAPRASQSGDAFSNWTQTTAGYTVTKSAFIDNSRASDLEFVYPGAAGATNWTASRCDVASVATDSSDSAKDDITMVQPCYANARLTYPGVGLPNSVENGYGLLGTPGQWYLDSAAGKVYYTPLSGESLTDSSAILAATDGLLSATGLSNVKFIGLAFEYGTWMGASGSNGVVDLQANLLTQGSATPRATAQLPSTIAFHDSSLITFSSNTLAHLGAGGVTFDLASNNNSVLGNVIYDISGSGISLGSGTFNALSPNTYAPPPAILEDQETVQDNYVHDTGIEFAGSVGIFAGWVKDTTISHNEVFRTSYSGISLGWGWGNTSDAAVMVNNHIDYNYVHDTLTTSVTDGGAIYTNGLEGASPASSVTGNYVDSDSKPVGAIYLDNGSSNFSVSNNVVTNATAAYAFFVTPGGWGNGNTTAKNNTVSNNYSSTTTGTINSDYNASNTVTGNSFSLSSWPTAATTLLNAAGLESLYASLNPTPEVNLALRGTATASSSYGSGNLPQAAIDNNAGTLWSSTAADTAAWWQLDLGASQPIESVALLTRQDGDYPRAPGGTDEGFDRRNIQIIASNNADMSGSTTLCTVGTGAEPFASLIPCSQGGSASYRYIRVVKTDTTSLTIGELRAYGPGPRIPTTVPTEIDDTNSSIVYSHVTGGGWTAQSYAGQFDGTQHYTTTDGDSVSYIFTGTGIDYISTMAPNRGSFSYTVDGGTPQTGTCYAATSVDQQACLSIRGLTYGSHTVKVTMTSGAGTYLTLDALNIYP